jgi:hypothetical protein
LKSSSPEPANQNQSNLVHIIYPWLKGIQVCSIKGSGPLQRGGNHKIVKMGWGHLKILFFYEARKAEFYMKAF